MAAMGVSLIFRELQKDDWEWVAMRAHPVLCEDTTGIVALRGEDLVSAAVFDSFTETSCNCHLVIEDPLVIRHRFLHMGFGYIFHGRGKELMVGYTPSDNAKALRLNKRLGFRETYRIPEACDKGIDMVIQEMRRDECRWLSTYRRAA